MLQVPSCSSKATAAATDKQKTRSNWRRPNWCSYGRSRQEGGSLRSVHLGTRDLLHRDLYSALLPAYCWDPSSSAVCGQLNAHHGGVFNLEFSPDGSLLVAACEKKSMLVLDPLRGSLVKHVENAHNDCVNCIRFLDSRMFASCSDDNSVSIWDIRYLKKRIRTLKGHSNWVKNIEFAQDEGLLVTSGFDGRIYTWDINKYSEGEFQFNAAFYTDGLMRTKLSPDGTKLMLCTSNGFLMVVHDLDLRNLSKDLRGFNPNIYHRMQQSNTSLHVGCMYNKLFRARRNRVELISDFPTGNDAEVISSLQVHPQGWSVLSRNSSADENSEWTTVHDIQEFSDWSEMPEEENEDDDYQMQVAVDEDNEDTMPASESNERLNSSEPSGGEGSGAFTRPVVHIRFNCRPNTDSGSNGGASVSGAAGTAAESDRPRVTVEEGGSSSDHSGAGPSEGVSEGSVDFTLRISSLEAFEAVAATLAAVRANRRLDGSAPPPQSVTIQENDEDRDSDDSTSSYSAGSSSDDEQRVIIGDANALRQEISDRVAFVIRSGLQLGGRRLAMRQQQQQLADAALTDPKMGSGTVRRHYRTRPRLTHYVAEPNVGRGFIKELCFSTDGRLVCSPFGHGVRILAFNSNCSEMCDCVPDRPTKLYEVTSNICHPYVVVSTKFSPTHCLLVSGCLSGKICFYQPVLG